MSQTAFDQRSRDVRRTVEYLPGDHAAVVAEELRGITDEFHFED